MPTPAARLVAVRARLGLSQSGFARLVRVSDLRTVRRWERAEIAVPGPVLVLLELLESGVTLPAPPDLEPAAPA